MIGAHSTTDPSLSLSRNAGDDWGRGGKRSLEPAGGTQLLPRTDNLYAHMTFKPLSAHESDTLSRSCNDAKHFAKRTLAAPGRDGVGKGSTMLHHVAGQRVGMFVPYAGLAQTPAPGRPC